MPPLWFTSENLRKILSGSLIVGGLLAWLFTANPGWLLILIIPPLISPDYFSLVLRNSFIVLATGFFAIAMWSWWVQEPVLLLKNAITNEQMMVIVTMIYVFLTFRILQQGSEHFGLARLPMLTVKPDKHHLWVKNHSKLFQAKNVRVYIDLIDKSPKSILEEFVCDLFSFIYKREKLQRMIVQMLPETEARLSYRELLVRLGFFKQIHDATGELSFVSDSEKRMWLKITIEYESDTGHFSPFIKTSYDVVVSKKGISVLPRMNDGIEFAMLRKN